MFIDAVLHGHKRQLGSVYSLALPAETAPYCSSSDEKRAEKPQHWQGHKHGQRIKYTVHVQHAPEQWRSWELWYHLYLLFNLFMNSATRNKVTYNRCVFLSVAKMTGQRRSGASHFTALRRHLLPFIPTLYSCKDSWEM